MQQLNLIFNDLPIPETRLWEQFTEEQKLAVVEILSRLLVQAAQADQRGKKTND